MKNLKYFSVLFFTFCATGAGAVTCQSLFGDSEIEKSIRALAELRFQLDSAQVNNSFSLTYSPLKKEYDRKEKSLLDYFTKNNYLSKEDFFNLIKREIQKTQQEFSKRTKDIQKEQAIQKNWIVDGSIGHFYPFAPSDSSIKPFEVMATSTTQIIWRGIGELINAKLDKQFHIENLSPSQFDSGLFPVTNVSYLDVKKWLDGLNELVRREEPKLNDLIVGHTKNYFYRLPLEMEIEAFLNAAVAFDFKSETFWKWYSTIDEDVTAKYPYVVQNYDYFGLISGDARTHLLENGKRFFAESLSVADDRIEFRITFRIRSVRADHSESAMGFRLIRERREP